MISVSALNRSLGTLLIVAVLACIFTTILNIPRASHIGGLFFVFAIILSIPLLLIGITTSISKRFPAFSEKAFYVAAFLFLITLLIILSIAPEIWSILIVGSLSTGLVICLIKLTLPVIQLIFNSVAIVLSTLLFLLVVNM
jgi:hypothetical protein